MKTKIRHLSFLSNEIWMLWVIYRFNSSGRLQSSWKLTINYCLGLYGLIIKWHIDIFNCVAHTAHTTHEMKRESFCWRLLWTLLERSFNRETKLFHELNDEEM
jgi:hypothetical protein